MKLTSLYSALMPPPPQTTTTLVCLHYCALGNELRSTSFCPYTCMHIQGVSVPEHVRQSPPHGHGFLPPR